MSPHAPVQVVGADPLAAAIAAQGASVDRVPPPAAGLDDVLLGTLTVAYADDRVDAANAAVARHLADARPVLTGVVPAGMLVDPGAERWVVVGGAGAGWADLGDAQRSAVCGACVLEGWAANIAAARALVESGEVVVTPSADHAVAVPGAMAVSPGTQCWTAAEPSTGATGSAPVLLGGPHALWRGSASGEALRRERALRTHLGPALAAALRASGPLPLAPLMARAATMGDDGHGTTDALSLLVAGAVVPALAAHDPRAVAALVPAAAADGAFGLSAAVAAGTAVAAGIPDGPATLLSGVTSAGRGTVAVRLAGLPGRWFPGRASPTVDAAGRAVEYLGDSAVATLLAPAAGSLGATDARAALERAEAPVLAAPAIGRTEEERVRVRPLTVPPAALAAALAALVRDLEAR